VSEFQENLDAVAAYVAGDDDSELAKTKAELAYALMCLERELNIAQQQAWQPIETAPRDGTWFVIVNSRDLRDGYEVGCYDPYMTTDYVETEPGSGLYKQEKRPSYDWRGFNNFYRATHWMPLPEPPK
jgi:hypothetical protein